MTERVTGPASYFPSIVKKYGQPIDYWYAKRAPSGPGAHGDGAVPQDRVRHGARARQRDSRSVPGEAGAWNALTLGPGEAPPAGGAPRPPQVLRRVGDPEHRALG